MQHLHSLQSWYLFRPLPFFTSYGKNKTKSPANPKGKKTLLYKISVFLYSIEIKQFA